MVRRDFLFNVFSFDEQIQDCLDIASSGRSGCRKLKIKFHFYSAVIGLAQAGISYVKHCAITFANLYF